MLDLREDGVWSVAEDGILPAARAGLGEGWCG